MGQRIIREFVIWLPELVAVEVVGQISIVIYGLATVYLYIQSLSWYAHSPATGNILSRYQ